MITKGKMWPAELIIKKRNQQELDEQEINEFIRMVVDGTISDAQIGKGHFNF